MMSRPDSMLRGNATRALLPALGVLALVGVVAVAAAGSLDTGSSEGRLPPESLFDTILTVFLIAAVPGLLIYVYGLLHAGEIRHWMRVPMGGIRAFIVFMLLVVGVSYLLFRNERAGAGPDEVREGALDGSRESGELGPQATYDAEFAWMPALVVIGLIVVAFTAMVLAHVRGRPAGARHEGETIAEALAALLDDTLDDLRAEKDPRRAVIAAYARLERVLALHGLERRSSEAPGEYLSRILPALEVERRSVRRLTDLFTSAKFSDHHVDAGMKEEAIAALSAVREEVRAAEAGRASGRLAALTAATGPS